jgi:hypothetical protein
MKRKVRKSGKEDNSESVQWPETFKCLDQWGEDKKHVIEKLGKSEYEMSNVWLENIRKRH